MSSLDKFRVAADGATPGEWKACRGHEDFDGSMFDIDDDMRSYYDAREITSIQARSGAVAAAHDLFEFRREDADFIVLSRKLAPLFLEVLASLEDCQQYLPQSPRSVYKAGAADAAQRAQAVINKIKGA